jgi:hypothetical protein
LWLLCWLTFSLGLRPPIECFDANARECAVYTEAACLSLEGRMSRLHTICTGARTAALIFLFAAPAAAQDTPLPAPATAPPAHLAFVEGTVDVVHEGVAERATDDLMLVEGDVVRTANGRAEIVFADGSILHLDHDTELEILSPLRMRLGTGRVLLRVSAAADTPYVIDTQAASTRLSARGEYDVTADRRNERLEVAVTRGSAEIGDGGTATLVRSGEIASILGPGGRVLIETFNSARFDAFERWSSDRVNGFTTYASARQLPSELRAYSGYFDSYGRWDYVAPYGNVWFPSVGPTWRPYYAGSWRLTKFGWTWIGHDPWAWPTHHFGRWGFTGVSWYWIPHRVWGPAWVSWSFVPGYVSWAPLGWDNRAVIRWHDRRGDHPAYWPDRAWTVVPRRAFGNRRSVREHAVDLRRLPPATRRAFADVAVPRATAVPAAAAAVAPSHEVAVPRGTRSEAPVWTSRGDVRATPRRGNVRAPGIQPPSGSAPAPRLTTPPVIDRTAPPPRSTAIERRGRPDRQPAVRAPQANPPQVDSPRAERPPRRVESGGARRDPGRVARPRSDDGGGDASRARPATRSDSGSRSGAVAVPRSGRSPQASSPSRGSAQGGAARRRPPR